MCKKPIIIDCDPGLDDAIALFMMFNNQDFDIKAITPVAGNVSVDKTTLNALKLVELAGANVPVAKGASKPLYKDLVTAEHVHGTTGLRDIVLPEPQQAADKLSAHEMIYQEASKYNRELQIIATGPLTNIATAILKYPDVKEKVKRIILMGGSCGCGNDAPAAEFNIYADSDAAKIVFESGIPITMVGLDVTHKALVYPDEIKEIGGYNNKIAKTASKILLGYLDFCKMNGFEGAVMHDPLAMAYAIDSEVMVCKPYHVDIETKGTFTNGKTVVDVHHVTGKAPNADVGVEIDRERFISILKKAMMSYDG
ncbi:MAG: nucleoside hydrolase [Clostridia bacterium]|nr:nucleoside hydrolase [Clostridia bacterium]